LPDVVIELMSPSTAEVDLTTKKDIYERKLKTQDYFVYDPKDPSSLRGWKLINRRYQSLSSDREGRLYCESLGLWLGIWEGKIENCQGNWLRFFEEDGNLVLMGDEAETQRAELERQQKEEAIQQLEIEKQQKERLAAKLRELNINPDEI
jgi:Putative restriction endonuclease